MCVRPLLMRGRIGKISPRIFRGTWPCRSGFESAAAQLHPRTACCCALASWRPIDPPPGSDFYLKFLAKDRVIQGKLVRKLVVEEFRWVQRQLGCRTLLRRRSNRSIILAALLAPSSLQRQRL